MLKSNMSEIDMHQCQICKRWDIKLFAGVYKGKPVEVCSKCLQQYKEFKMNWSISP